ncbi:sigma-70 family RNA polymerase sigma factor [soil metagenome]
MPESLECIYDAHAQAVFAFVLNLTRDEAETADVLQDVFHKLVRQPGALEGVANGRVFLLRMAHRVMIDRFRRRATRTRLEGAVEARVFAATEDPDAEAHRRALEAALGELPEEQRAVVHLKLWGGLTFAEIAEALEVPANTAASRYRYGIDKLQALLRPYYEALQ